MNAMGPWWQRVTIVAIAVLAVSSGGPGNSDPLPSPRAGARLVEMGWDEPDTRFMRQHIQVMERAPFDGCVFHVTYARSDGKRGNFTWELWGRRRFTMAELQPAIDDLRATPFHRFDENFLRINVTPGDINWADDTAYVAIVNNVRLAARVARAGGCRGVMLDVEQYQTHLFNFPTETARDSRSWEQLAVLARSRGKAVMTAMQSEFPGLTLFLTWGYSMPLYQTRGGHSPLSEAPEGLLAPFLDGIFDVVSDSTKVVDGHEMSYAYREPRRFQAAADSVHHAVLRIMANPERYASHSEVGFGIWLDNDWKKVGWDAQHPEKNFYTPASFESTLDAALAYTDRYVWIYSETPRWWSDGDTLVALPAAYVDVMQRKWTALHR